MKGLLALVVLAVLAAPLAAAQTVVNPVRGSFQDVYLIAGRAVDSRGEPVAGANLTVALEQKGVRAAPLTAVTNCKGDFITYFTLRDVSADGRVRLTLHARDGIPDAVVTEGLDPFFRRTDATLRLEGPWNYRCEANQDVWPVSVSVTGRIVNRTTPYVANGVTYEAQPFTGLVRLRYMSPEGEMVCPPAANAPPDVCDFLYVDERGDFRYTFTFGAPVPSNGTMHVVIDEKVHSMEIDPVTRLAVLHVEATGLGVPQVKKESPASGAPLAALAAALAGVLLARRRLR